MKKISKIVLTGGACAGKTKSLSTLKDKIASQGYNAIIMPEASTTVLLKGYSPDTVGREKFQEMILRLQLENEQLLINHMQESDSSGVLLCDRGAIDGRAYMSEEMFQRITESVGVKSEDLYKRYDAIFHMQSLAVDAPEKYSMDNNEKRLEDIEESRRIDRALLRAWQPHQYVRVIDNSTDFTGKVERVSIEILEFLARNKGEKEISLAFGERE